LTDYTSQELLDHFLNTRLAEIEQAKNTDLSDLLDQLDETRRALENYRIPFDACSHLREWADALRAFV
jgi:predicted DNA-binding ribbon-helix-helix protein